MLYVLIILIIIGVVANLLSKKYSLTNLSYKRDISKRVVEIGENIDITSIIENKKLLPVTFLRVLEKLPNDLDYVDDTNIFKEDKDICHQFNIKVMPYQRVKRTYTAMCTKRGRHAFNDVILSAGDIIGLKEFSMQTYLTQQIVAIPKPYDIQNNLVNYGDFMGNISVKRWIINDPIISIGVREYTGSEPQNTIHWASSLRMNKLMVKQFDYTTDSKIMIILNIESNKPFWMNIEVDKIEKCISIARTIAESCEENHIQYGMITNAQIGTGSGKVKGMFPGLGNAHLNILLEALGCIEYGVFNGFEQTIEELMMNKEGSTTNVIITPNILDEYIEPINSLCNYFPQTVLISVDEDNISKINCKVQSFTEKRV